MNVQSFRIASITLALATFAALGGLVEAAQPSPSETIPAQTVYYGDLNLDAPSGVKALYKRIQNAAENVCKQQVVDLDSLAQRFEWRDCVRSAVARGIAKVGNEQLTALYAQGRSKKVG